MAAKKRARAARPSDDDEGMQDLGEGRPAPSSATEESLRETEARLDEREPIATIRRVNEAGRLVFLDSVSASSVTEDWIAESYGGGKYNVYKRGLREDKSWGYIGSETFEIDESIPFKGSLKGRAARGMPLMRDDVDDDGAGRERVFNPDGSPAGGGGALVEAGVFNLIKASQDQSQMSTQFFMAMMQQMNEGARATAQMNMQMIQTMQAANKGTSLPEILTAIAALAPLITPLLARKSETLGVQEILALLKANEPKAPDEKLSDTLEMLGKMKDVFGSAQGEGEGGAGNFMGIIEKALGALPAILEARRPAVQPNTGMPPMNIAAAASALPAARAELAASTIQPEGQSVDGASSGAPDVFTAMAPYVGQMKMAASFNKNAEVTANMIWEYAPQDLQSLLLEALDDDTFVEKLLARFPEMASHRVWTTSVVEYLRAIVFGDEDEEDVVETPTKPDSEAPSTAPEKK